MAIVGVVISVFVSTFLLISLTPLTLLVALAFGVVVSPTDAASVIDTFKRLGVPRKLSTILEGEALFNDATAIVLFSAVTSLMLSPIVNALRFATVFGGGMITGLIIAFIAEKIHRLMSNSIYRVILSISVAYGAYATAEVFHFSGIVAVAIAGIFMSRGFKNDVKSKEGTLFFWEVAGFMANAIAFLFLGLIADVSIVITYVYLIAICFIVVLIARLASVYSIFSLTSKIEEKTPAPWQLTTFLGGMRGAVSVALALSLPEGFVKDLIVTLTFGVAFISLIVQGSVLEIYVKKKFSGIE
ncbi:MAG: cation:proton antiporter [Candidatus Bathyarchaeia archaeon]